jgi:iron complex transport system substrate-binding protein
MDMICGSLNRLFFIRDLLVDLAEKILQMNPFNLRGDYQRIVCLTEETVETLYLLGEDARIVGVSGYAVRPSRVRREKPRVSAFVSADMPRILALKPDLVLAFSDLQAPIVAELVRAGVAVHAFNQRDIAGILAMIRLLAAMVGAPEKGDALALALEARLEALRDARADRPKVRVFFEEWDSPMISAIGWVSELIALAGGVDVFSDLAKQSGAQGRIVSSEAVIAAAPELIVASWCGKKVSVQTIRSRPGWQDVPAVGHGQIVEIKSPLILQPGPAALTDGLDALIAAIDGARAREEN